MRYLGATYAHGSVKGCCTKFPVNATDHGRGKPKSLPSTCNILCNHLDYRVPSFLPRDLPLQKQHGSRGSYIMCSYDCVMGDQRRQSGRPFNILHKFRFSSRGPSRCGSRRGGPAPRAGSRGRTDGQYVSAGYCGRRFLRDSSNKGTGWKSSTYHERQTGGHRQREFADTVEGDDIIIQFLLRR